MILANKHLDTDDYLKKMLKYKRQNQLIYNQKAKNLQYIKQIMGEINNSY